MLNYQRVYGIHFDSTIFDRVVNDQRWEYIYFINDCWLMMSSGIILANTLGTITIIHNPLYT